MRLRQVCAIQGHLQLFLSYRVAFINSLTGRGGRRGGGGGGCGRIRFVLPIARSGNRWVRTSRQLLTANNDHSRMCCGIRHLSRVYGEYCDAYISASYASFSFMQSLSLTFPISYYEAPKASSLSSSFTPLAKRLLPRPHGIASN